jgi:hypothetical protein
MAKKFSTGLRNEILGFKPTVTGTGFGCTVTTNVISDTGNGLAIFRPGDKVVISGFTDSSNNGLKTVVSVAVSGASMVVSENLATEAAGDTVIIALLNSRAFKDIFRDGVLEIYSGSQPSDADQAETGTKLARITVNSGAFVPGAAANGLEFGDPASGSIAKSGSEVWSGVGLANGVVGWFRFYTNMYDTGASPTKARFDGSIGVSGSSAQMIVATTTIALNAPVTVNTFSVPLAA